MAASSHTNSKGEFSLCCLFHISHMDIVAADGVEKRSLHSACREHGKTIHMSDSWLSVRQETWLLGVSGLKSPCFRLHKGASCFDHRKRFSSEESPARRPCSSSSLSCVKTGPGLQEIPYLASECQLVS